MRQADAFRVARRARRVLDESEIVGRGSEDLTVRTGHHAAHEGRAGLEDARHLGEIVVLRKRKQAFEQVGLGEECGPVELPQDAKQLVAVLVADADRHGYRHDAAEHGGPVSDDELLVGMREHHELVALLHAAGLQRPEQRQRPVPEAGKRYDALVLFAVNETNLAVPAPEIGEQVDHCVVKLHG